MRLDYSGAGGNGSTQACVSVRAAPGGGSGNNSGTDCPIISNRGPILSGQKLIPRTPISDCNQADNWTLDGKAGHRVTIRMRRVSGDLDSFLELWPPDATSTPEVIDDDSDGNQNARIDRYALQQTGTYRISATRFPGTRTTGQYELTVTDQDGSGGSASTPVVLGGMDLEGYCRSIKNKLYAVANSDNITWNCESWAGGSSGRRGSAGTDFDTSPIPIDMNDVCRVQYQPEAYAQQRDPGDPYSWLCYVNR
ncbi:MAG: hypothetical protein HYX51_06955 [Chloroflexi bacterium]|nr:hypothetical protein [Chloroflexota bacterium]